MEKIIPRDSSFRDFEVEHEFPKIGRKTMLLNARRIQAAGEHPSMILLAIEDRTEKVIREREHQQTVAQLKQELEECKEKK